MIQRRQTLWLALTALCMGLCFAFPVAEYTIDQSSGQQVLARLDLVAKDNPEMMNQLNNMEPVVEYSQRLSGMPTWPLVTLVLLCGAVALGSIFLFRKRMVQVRIVSLGFMINVVYSFVLFFWAVDKYAELVSSGFGGSEAAISWGVGSYLPLATLVLFFLAQRAIRKDEARVRAADRLR